MEILNVNYISAGILEIIFNGELDDQVVNNKLVDLGYSNYTFIECGDDTALYHVNNVVMN
jgi:hypothetical protein